MTQIYRIRRWRRSGNWFGNDRDIWDVVSLRKLSVKIRQPVNSETEPDWQCRRPWV